MSEWNRRFNRWLMLISVLLSGVLFCVASERYERHAEYVDRMQSQAEAAAAHSQAKELLLRGINKRIVGEGASSAPSVPEAHDVGP